jgi:hypothetical protein
MTTIPLSRLTDLQNAAMDEIYALRAAMASEAVLLREHLTYKTFPKSRRTIAEEQVERMFLAARGRVTLAYAGHSFFSLDVSILRTGASKALTVDAWAATQSEESRYFGRPLIEARQHLDWAVEEINGLRRGIAYEADVLTNHVNPYFPVAAGRIVAEQLKRMRHAAIGETFTAYRPLRSMQKSSLTVAGADQCLSNGMWLEDQQMRRGLSVTVC